MNLDFSINGQIDPVATYAAVLSSAIALWEFWKWRNRNAIRLTCTPNMIEMPRRNKEAYIVANVVNLGDRPTTITHLCGYYWKTHWDYLLRRNRLSFIVNSPNVPKVVQPGEQWMGQIIQDKEMDQRLTSGVLKIGVFHSLSKKEIMRRVRSSKKEVKNEAN
jgi:hypothetical protein